MHAREREREEGRKDGKGGKERSWQGEARMGSKKKGSKDEGAMAIEQSKQIKQSLSKGSIGGIGQSVSECCEIRAR